MKNISFPLVILSLLLFCCTTETIDPLKSVGSKVSNQKLTLSERLVPEGSPENLANIYDFAGKIHNDILDIYLSSNDQDTTIAQISQQIEKIAVQNNEFMLLNSGTNISVNFIVIQEIINSPQTLKDQTIANSTMTSGAKKSLSDFMNVIALWHDDSFAEIYEFIISYETAVMTNEVFNSEDKRIILTTCSIIRYSVYYDKENKDKDWNTSRGHGVGALSGAMEHTGVAIKRSLVTGIRLNNLKR
ncbi:hypothetical protein [Flavobacterium geliluteum]|uniref:Uncharacterized protein n=1 Tax=Flavobacterium geliluteum TaxID=2816120 RepID=A0A940XDF2_9FLAO|nr:hypothetical protein [Flavobacterium geliluteum]MBP4137243.1 hypothetical protein [Flavobacterium geliluteum]